MKKFAWKNFAMDHKIFIQKTLPTIAFLVAAFLLGRNLAEAVQSPDRGIFREATKADRGTEEAGREATKADRGTEEAGRKATKADRGTEEAGREATKADRGIEEAGREATKADRGTEEAGREVTEVSALGYSAEVMEASQTWGLLFTENWGLGFGEAGKCPTGNASVEELKQYNAYFLGDTEEKKIYLTFDCGYENGNTEAILDALKKHDAPATFFVVGHYLESAPDLVKRMVAEGHTVGNHTYHHPDMSKISDVDSFQKEMEDVRVLYRDIIGEEMAMYYRPPQGKYSTANLQMAKDMGYATFFWSLAYVDWNVDQQPGHDEAFEKLTKRIHPGAIVLLHNTSRTNGEILDELLTKWEEMGYTFGTLEEVKEEAKKNL